MDNILKIKDWQKNKYAQFKAKSYDKTIYTNKSYDDTIYSVVRLKDEKIYKKTDWIIFEKNISAITFFCEDNIHVEIKRTIVDFGKIFAPGNYEFRLLEINELE